MAAKAHQDEIKVSDPWYTVIPTDLVPLRRNEVLPRFKLDGKGVWVERKPEDSDWED